MLALGIITIIIGVVMVILAGSFIADREAVFGVLILCAAAIITFAGVMHLARRDYVKPVSSYVNLRCVNDTSRQVTRVQIPRDEWQLTAHIPDNCIVVNP